MGGKGAEGRCKPLPPLGLAGRVKPGTPCPSAMPSPFEARTPKDEKLPSFHPAAPFSLLDRKGEGRKTKPFRASPLTSVRRPSSVRSPVRSPPHIELAPVGGGVLPGDFPSRGVLLSTQHSDAIFSNSFPSLRSTHHEVILIKRIIIKKRNPRA